MSSFDQVRNGPPEAVMITLVTCSRANWASATPFLFAVSASTENRSGWRLSRSTVLDPMEPVAPRIVTLRTAAGFGLARFAVVIQSPGKQVLFPGKLTSFPGQQA